MSWLNGEVLSYIQINRLSLILSFQSGGTITSECQVNHLNSSGEVISSYVPGEVPQRLSLVRLIDHVVQKVDHGPGKLKVQFDNGDSVLVERTSQEPEVAVLSFPSGHEVVI
jgi:hypothetical protein